MRISKAFGTSALRRFAAWSLLALAACAAPASAPFTAASGDSAPLAAVAAPQGADAAAAAYCRKTGGTVQTRAAWYSTSSGVQAPLGATGVFCHYVAKDRSTIDILASTLYSTKPTLAALAYYAETKLNKTCQKYLADPAVCYCRQQLVGSDFYLAGGSWVLAGQRPNPSNRTPFCVFSDFSVIDSWGLAYHSAGIVRGIDLSKVLRYKPT